MTDIVGMRRTSHVVSSPVIVLVMQMCGVTEKGIIT